MLTRNSYLANALLGGPVGLCLAALLYVGMSWCSYTFMPPDSVGSDMGLCLPSPSQWPLPPLMGKVFELLLTGLCVLLAVSLNARFTLIPGTGVLYATVFLIVAGAIPKLNSGPGTPGLLLCTVLICTHLLFSLYGRRNASRGLCVIFSLLSWGSMIQYSFALLMPIFVLGAIFIGVLRLKEFISVILGIITPYWIIFGLGIVQPEQFHIPALTNLLGDFAAPGTLFYIMIGQALAAFVCLLLTASNALVPSTTGTQHRSYTAFINLLGIAMVWFMLFDSANLLAYTYTLALCLGFQCARYASLPRHKFAYLPVIVCLPLFLALFVLSILYASPAS